MFVQPNLRRVRKSNELKVILEVGELKADNMSKMKESYVALAIEPDNVRYEWMRP
jgi:hypothetical protein